MNKFRLTIWQRIFGGFSILVLLLIVGAIAVVVQLNKNVSQIDNYTEVVQPSVENLKELRNIAGTSMRLITSYVYFQDETQNDIAKNELRKLQRDLYPNTRDRLIGLSNRWSNASETDYEILNNTFAAIDTMHTAERRILDILNNKNSTEKNLLVQDANFQYQMQKLNSLFQQVQRDVDILIADKNEIGIQTQEEVNRSSVNLRNEAIFISIVAVILGFALAFFLAQSIVSRIKLAKNSIKQLSEGTLPRYDSLGQADDEIGEMESALKTLILGLQNTLSFAQKIGTGDYNYEFKPLSERDILGNSLLRMRNNLRDTELEEKERKWKNEGTLLVSDILRNSNRSFEEITDELITTLVRYLDANQGGIFLKEQEGRHEQLRLTAYYAWEKKRFIRKVIQKNEGLTGQAWQEGRTMYLTEVPEEYIQVTSGLGKANPRAILIVPMLLNKEVFGIIEVASFHLLEDYQIEFLELIGETVAATLSIIQSNITGQRLLEESDQMTQQLRAQEEEMRQNMEELQATQEEMERVQSELEYRTQLIESEFFLIELDHKKNIALINELALDALNYSKATLLERSVFGIFAQEGELQQGFNEMATNTVWKADTTILSRSGDEIWVSVLGTAIFNIAGTIERYVLILTDISQIKLHEKKIKDQALKIEETRNTEKKRTEYALEAQKKMLEKLVTKHEEEKKALKQKIAELKKQSD